MISDSLHQVVSRYGQEIAIVDGSERITYGELSERVDAVREWLRAALDPQPGNVIAVSLDNSWQFVACLFAASDLGCLPMPCNPQWRVAELRELAGRLNFRGAVIEPRFIAEWNQIVDVVLTADRMCDRAATNRAAANRAATVRESVSASDSAPALYLSTSGSTGSPRLVLRSHLNLIENARNVSSTLDLGPGRRFLAVVPFHFANGFNNSLMLPLLSGATLVMMRQFNPAACAELVAREKVDTLFGSPFIYGFLADRDPALLSTLKHCFTAGGRIPANVVERWRDRLGVKIRQLYGMSEAGVIAIERSARPPASSTGACVGEPIQGVEIMVLGTDKQRLQRGETGELAVRSASVMSAYFGEAELSLSRFHDGFFRTGDLGYLDAEGDLYLTGRISRVMNIAGVKVDPVELERVVEMLPNVAACHVDSVAGGGPSEVIRARVVPREGLPVTRREVIEQCRQRLAEYKLPRIVEFLEASPVTIAGKIPRSASPDSESHAILFTRDQK